MVARRAEWARIELHLFLSKRGVCEDRPQRKMCDGAFRWVSENRCVRAVNCFIPRLAHHGGVRLRAWVVLVALTCMGHLV